MTLWYTVWVAEASQTRGLPDLRRSRHRQGFLSSCTARRRNSSPDVMCLSWLAEMAGNRAYGWHDHRSRDTGGRV